MKIVRGNTLPDYGFNITDDLISRAKTKWNAKKLHVTIDGYGDEHNK